MCLRSFSQSAGTASSAWRRLLESKALGVARVESALAKRVCGDVHGLTQAVAEACNLFVTKIGLGPSGYVGPVDVMGVLGGHGERVYDELRYTRSDMRPVAETSPVEVREPSPVSQTMCRRDNNPRPKVDLQLCFVDSAHGRRQAARPSSINTEAISSRPPATVCLPRSMVRAAEQSGVPSQSMRQVGPWVSRSGPGSIRVKWR